MPIIGNFIDSVLWWFRPPPVILLRLNQGHLQVRRGMVLAFSREIPESVRQQLRNIWNAR